MNPSSSTPLLDEATKNVIFFNETTPNGGYITPMYRFVLRNLVLFAIVCVGLVLLAIFHPEKALDYLGFPRCVQIFSNVARPYWQCRGEDHPQRRHY